MTQDVLVSPGLLLWARFGPANLLVDAFPRSVEMLRDSFRETAERGVEVVVLTYQGAAPILGVRLHSDPASETTRQRWPGDWLNISIDGSELLVSLLDYEEDRVHQAIWTSSPVLGLAYQNGLSSEAILNRLESLIEAGVEVEELQRECRELKSIKAPWCAGYHQLIELTKA